MGKQDKNKKKRQEIEREKREKKREKAKNPEQKKNNIILFQFSNFKVNKFSVKREITS